MNTHKQKQKGKGKRITRNQEISLVATLAKLEGLVEMLARQIDAMNETWIAAQAELATKNKPRQKRKEVCQYKDCNGAPVIEIDSEGNDLFEQMEPVQQIDNN